jgi:excinuclease ABC subunit C
MSAGKTDNPALLEKVSRFPTSPGVYIMKDARKRILYIGKAVNLRSRVRSYFSKSSDTRIFFSHLVRRIDDVDCILTSSETEALILENNLIKKHRPVYNIRLRDDKNYVCLKVTITEEWPRVLVTRRYQNDGNLYFGPYGSSGSVRSMLRVIKKLFPLRTCSNGFFKNRARAKRPCIEYDIGQCSAPCVDFTTREEYLRDVEEVLLFLRGKNSELSEILEQKMTEAAENRRYELAGRYRDQIRAIQKVFEVQKADEISHGDMDVFAHIREGESVGIQELVIREGKIVNSHCHAFRSSLETVEIIASFLSQYYLAERYIPRRVLCDLDFPERGILEDWLGERRGAKVEILVPARGDKKRLIEMAQENARNSFDIARTRGEKRMAALQALATALDLPDVPGRIECYDISNFQGALAVGAMVSFEDGLADRGSYRKFRIRTVEGADDFRMMREVLERRLESGLKNPETLPDLILIDGGKGQLGVAIDVTKELGLEHIAVASLAKERRHRGTTERVFVPGRSSPLPIAQESPESLLLQAIRDEAHRFAITYHRSLRNKATTLTGLEGIPGVGEKRRQKLIERFGKLDEIIKASVESLAEVVGPNLAKTIHESLRQTKTGRGTGGNLDQTGGQKPRP